MANPFLQRTLLLPAYFVHAAPAAPEKQHPLPPLPEILVHKNKNTNVYCKKAPSPPQDSTNKGLWRNGIWYVWRGAFDKRRVESRRRDSCWRGQPWTTTAVGARLVGIKSALSCVCVGGGGEQEKEAKRAPFIIIPSYKNGSGINAEMDGEGG
jgi:hypothetical protein